MDETLLPVLKYKVLEDGFDLKKGNDHAVGLDVSLPDDVTVPHGGYVVVPLQIAVEPPAGYYTRLDPRSSLFSKYQVDMPSSIIDPDYRGSIHAQLYNFGTYDCEFKAGTRIAQLTLVELPKYVALKVDKLSETKRGDKGQGSTGV